MPARADEQERHMRDGFGDRLKMFIHFGVGHKRAPRPPRGLGRRHQTGEPSGSASRARPAVWSPFCQSRLAFPFVRTRAGSWNQISIGLVRQAFG